MTSSRRNLRWKRKKIGNKSNIQGGLNRGKVGRKREGFILSPETWNERGHQGVVRVRGRAEEEASSVR